jgi:hypothetical protein
MIEAVSGSRIGWKYVGQTKNGNRGYDHFRELGKNIHFNIKLQRYFKKYKHSSLKFSEIFECPERHLNFWEKFWIKSFDAIKNGFNIDEGGNKPPIFYRKCTLTNYKTGETITCNSIKEFSEKYSLCATGISAVLRGVGNICGEWFNPANGWRPNKYQLLDPTGQEHEFINIAEFSVAHDLNINSLRSLLRGDRHIMQGWKRLSDPIRIRKPFINNLKKYKFLNPNGEILETNNCRQFARQYNLSATKLASIATGKLKTYKGWTKWRA